MKSIDAVHQDALRSDLPPFRAGDTVRVHVRIREGDKERVQIFEGVVIQRRGGVRRARLFYLRELSGKKARLRSKVRDIAALMARPEDAGSAEEAIAAEEQAVAEAPEPEKPE